MMEKQFEIDDDVIVIIDDEEENNEDVVVFIEDENEIIDPILPLLITEDDEKPIKIIEEELEDKVVLHDLKNEIQMDKEIREDNQLFNTINAIELTEEAHQTHHHKDVKVNNTLRALRLVEIELDGTKPAHDIKTDFAVRSMIRESDHIDNM